MKQVLLFVKGDEVFCGVDRECAFGEGDDLHCSKITIGERTKKQDAKTPKKTQDIRYKNQRSTKNQDSNKFQDSNSKSLLRWMIGYWCFLMLDIWCLFGFLVSWLLDAISTGIQRMHGRRITRSLNVPLLFSTLMIVRPENRARKFSAFKNVPDRFSLNFLPTFCFKR